MRAPRRYKRLVNRRVTSITVYNTSNRSVLADMIRKSSDDQVDSFFFTTYRILNPGSGVLLFVMKCDLKVWSLGAVRAVTTHTRAPSPLALADTARRFKKPSDGINWQGSCEHIFGGVLAQS